VEGLLGDHGEGWRRGELWALGGRDYLFSGFCRFRGDRRSAGVSLGAWSSEEGGNKKWSSGRGNGQLVAKGDEGIAKRGAEGNPGLLRKGKEIAYLRGRPVVAGGGGKWNREEKKRGRGEGLR